MQGRLIQATVFQEGVKEFAERARVEIRPESDTAYLATFADGHMARISNDAIGLSINYSSVVALIHDVSLARIFLQENWLGVEGTPFYFSVHVTEGQAFLFLETNYFPQSKISAAEIADLLCQWEIYWPVATQSLSKVSSGITRTI
jgi:hypothetical protein